MSPSRPRPTLAMPFGSHLSYFAHGACAPEFHRDILSLERRVCNGPPIPYHHDTRVSTSRIRRTKVQEGPPLFHLGRPLPLLSLPFRALSSLSADPNRGMRKIARNNLNLRIILADDPLAREGEINKNLGRCAPDVNLFLVHEGKKGGGVMHRFRFK